MTVNLWSCPSRLTKHTNFLVMAVEPYRNVPYFKIRCGSYNPFPAICRAINGYLYLLP